MSIVLFLEAREIGRLCFYLHKKSTAAAQVHKNLRTHKKQIMKQKRRLWKQWVKYVEASFIVSQGFQTEIPESEKKTHRKFRIQNK